MILRVILRSMPSCQPRAGRAMLAVLLLGGLACTSAASASAPRAPTPTTMAVTIDAGRPGAVIARGFVGLSFEAPNLRSGEIASPSSHLPNLLRSLGGGLLRFAGDSVDHTQWLAPGTAPAPWAIATTTPTDLNNVAALARGSGWGVVLGLNLGHPSAPAVSDEARTATMSLGSSLTALEIGNEPDLYARPVPEPYRAVLGSRALRDHSWGFASYSAQYSSLRQAVTSAAPAAALYGPATASSTWLRPFAALATPGLAALTQHYYPFDRCHGGRLLAHGPSIASLLSRRTEQRELRVLSAAVATGARRGLALRVDEANSVACGGQPNTSDTFASALWAADLGLLAAHAGVVGVDFHGGLGSCQAMGTLYAPWYSPLCAQSDGQLRPRPEYYGLLLLSSLEGYAFVPAAYHSSANVSVYALRAADGTLRIVIIDMDSAPATGGARPVALSVALQTGGGYRHAVAARLSAPSLSAKHAITYGGAVVSADGRFPGATFSPLAGAGGRFSVTVSPGSATVVAITP